MNDPGRYLEEFHQKYDAIIFDDSVPSLIDKTHCILLRCYYQNVTQPEDGPRVLTLDKLASKHGWKDKGKRSDLLMIAYLMFAWNLAVEDDHFLNKYYTKVQRKYVARESAVTTFGGQPIRMKLVKWPGWA